MNKKQHRESVLKEATSTSATVTTCPPASASGGLRPPRWLGIFLGRLVLRVCPANRPAEPCDGCHLRALCRCAHDNHVEAARVEARVWAVIAACGLGALLISLLR